MDREFHSEQDINSKNAQEDRESLKQNQKFQIDTLGGDTSMLHLAAQIDRGIQKKVQSLETDTAKKWRKIHLTFRPIKQFVLFSYALLAIIERPSWCIKIDGCKTDMDAINWDLTKPQPQSCLDYHPEEIQRFKLFDPFYCNTNDWYFTGSNCFKLPPYATVSYQVFSLFILTAFQMIRNRYRAHNKTSLISWYCQIFLTTISLIDIAIHLLLSIKYKYTYPIVAAIVRPFYVILQTRSLREYWIKYSRVMRDSMSMVFSIFLTIFWFSWFMRNIFQGTLQGVRFFNTLGDAFFNMLVCMTTSNYPDVMLPAYAQSRWNFLIWLFYMTFVLMLLMNLLLAIFYSNFKFRVEEAIDKKEEKRNRYLYDHFICYGGEKGYLNKNETYCMFMLIHSLINTTNSDITLEDASAELNTSGNRRISSTISGSINSSNMLSKSKYHKKVIIISGQHYEYIYLNKIACEEEVKGQLKFTEMNILLRAYEFWAFLKLDKNKRSTEAVNHKAEEKFQKQQTITRQQTNESQLSLNQSQIKYLGTSQNSSVSDQKLNFNQHLKIKTTQFSNNKQRVQSSLLESLVDVSAAAMGKDDENANEGENTRRSESFISQEDDQDTIFKKTCNQKVADVMNSPVYELIVNIIGIFNIFFLLARNEIEAGSDSWINSWIIGQFLVNMFFMLEIITNVTVFGFTKIYSQDFRIWLESFCQALNITAFVFFFGNPNNKNTVLLYLEIVIFTRMLKVLTFINEIKTMKIIVETIVNLVAPLGNLYGIIFTIYYVFAIIGIEIFGGKITKDVINKQNIVGVPNDYNLVNFNDMISAFVTLWALMIVNNWMVIVSMYCQVMGNNWYRLYFCIFYYFSVVIGINIIVAFAIDMYASVERLYQDRQKTLDNIELELHNKIQERKSVYQKTAQIDQYPDSDESFESEFISTQNGSINEGRPSIN